MPTYDYKCPKCNKKIEIAKPISELQRKEKCSKCDTVLEKILSAPAFHLKGTGWYVTDYKTTNKKKDD